MEIDTIFISKKQHVCGSKEWKVIKLGSDIKLECTQCNRVILVKRSEMSKKFKEMDKDGS